ncbi:FliH/SctL family protein [Alkalibacter mobilis]|uniref:FliH/SctL family protein n=1 Tax=Alkalibacter mobilis TaxID=2787712 RepID=UPI002FC36601
MIPIALSYKIIKNPDGIKDAEKQLHPMDLSDFKKKTINLEESDDQEEDIDKFVKEMENRIRSQIEEELSVKREELLKEARAQAETIKDAARRESVVEGYNEGFQRGFEDGRIETESMRKNAIKLLDEAEKKVKDYFIENEKRIIQLSVNIAEKIIHHKIDHHAENVMQLAKPVLQEYGKTQTVIITCNPNNTDFIKGHLNEIEKMCPNAHILILEDEQLEKNGVVVENESQITDLQIKKQLQRFLELAAE